jgi:hypothetical protein
MGNFSCLKSQTINSHIELDKQIDYKTYTSTSDTIFKKLEIDYNLLNNIQLHDYVILLSIHRELLKEDDLHPFSEQIELHSFVNFVSHKICEHPILIHYLEYQERGRNIFEDYMKELYEMVRLAMKEFRKERIKVVQKIYLLPHAILYCNSPNSIKIQFLFNVFSTNGLFQKTPLVEEFFFIQIATASCILFFIQNRISDKYQDLKTQVEVHGSVYDTTEMKDLHKLKDIFMKNLFGNETALNRELYEERIKDDNCIWIFSAKGIRSWLEIYNE